jgi:hypothetical protein
MTTLERLSRFDWLYLSGISLSLYGETGRARLTELLGPCAGTAGRWRSTAVPSPRWAIWRRRVASLTTSCLWLNLHCQRWRMNRPCSRMLTQVIVSRARTPE